MPLFRKMDEQDLPSFVKVRKSKRARRMALRLDSKERLFHLVVPPGMSLKRAHAFVEQHELWMKEKLRDLPQPVKFEDGAVIPVFGRNRTIRIIRRKTLKTTDIILKHNEILVLTNSEDPSPRIKRFLIKLAKEKLTELAQEKAKLIHKKIKDVNVRDTKSRWGSCSDEANLSFSWRLILAPMVAFDYVVAHEVAHLKHMDHSNNFWKLCRTLADDFLEGHYWMEHHGNDLMRFG